MTARSFLRTLLDIKLVFRRARTQEVPPPAKWALPEDLPKGSPPAEMSLERLPTGVTHRSAAFACQGGSWFDRRDFTMTAALVRHPRGDLLIDAGFAKEIDAHFRSMPWAFRLVTRYQRGNSAANQLDQVKYDHHRLRAIVLTHAHWDHVSGVADFPDTPIWVSTEELNYIRDRGVHCALAKSLGGSRFEEYSFEGGRYLGFSRSHDVYGDGAVVIVPCPGHTPGSVAIFVALRNGTRYAFIGDLVWQLDCLMQRRERPLLARLFADADSARVREGIEHFLAIKRKFPGLTIIPAHDGAAFSQIPILG